MASIFAAPSTGSTGGSIFGSSSSTGGGGINMDKLLAMRAQSGAAESGHSPFGFVGNLVGGVVDVGKGIAGLMNAGIHDYGRAAASIVPGRQDWGAFSDNPNDQSKLIGSEGILGQMVGYTDEGFHPTEGAIVKDFAERYGPLWPGGEPASQFAEELYQKPASFLLDALTVAGGVSKAAQGTGLVGKLTNAAGVSGKSVLAGTEAGVKAAGIADKLVDTGTLTRTAEAAGMRSSLDELAKAGELNLAQSTLRHALPRAQPRLTPRGTFETTAESYNPVTRAVMTPLHRFGFTEDLSKLEARKAKFEADLADMPGDRKPLGEIALLDKIIEGAQELELNRVEKPAIATSNINFLSRRVIGEIKSHALAAREASSAEEVAVARKYLAEDPNIFERMLPESQGLDIDVVEADATQWAERQGIVGGGRTVSLTSGDATGAPLSAADEAAGVMGAGEGLVERSQQMFATLPPEEGVVYHLTPSENLSGIAAEGLQPSAAEDAVFFAENGQEAFNLIPPGNAREGYVALRTKDEGLLTFSDRVGEKQLDRPLDPGGIEYLGGDGQWHRVADASRYPPRLVGGGGAGTDLGGGTATLVREAQPFGDELLPDELDAAMKTNEPFTVRTEAAVAKARAYIDEVEANRQAMTESGWAVDAQIDGARRHIRALYDGLKRRVDHERADTNVQIDPVARFTDEMRLLNSEKLSGGYSGGGLSPQMALDRAMRSVRAKHGLDLNTDAKVAAVEAAKAAHDAERAAKALVTKAERGAAQGAKTAERTATSATKAAESRAKAAIAQAERTATNARKAAENAKDPKFRAAKLRTAEAAERKVSELSEKAMLGQVTATNKAGAKAAKMTELSEERAAQAIEKANAKAAQLAQEAEVAAKLAEPDFIGGPDLAALDDALHAQNIPQPIYVPHIDATRLKTSDMFVSSRPVGANIYATDPHNKQMRLALLKRGTWLNDPIEVAKRRGARMVREEETYTLWDTLIRQTGFEVADAALIPDGFQLVSPDQMFIHYRSRVTMLDEIDKALTSGVDPDAAHAIALKKTLELNQAEVAALQEAGKIKMYAVPKVVLKNLDSAAKYAPVFGGPKVRTYWDTPMQLWRGLTLTASPRWVVNNVLGNVVFGAMQGVKAADVMRIFTEKFRVMMSNWVRRRMDLPEKEVRKDSLTGQINQLPGAENVGHSFFGSKVEQYVPRLGPDAEKSWAGRVIMRGQNTKVSAAFRSYGAAVRHLNGIIEDSFREGSYVAAIEKAQGASAIRRTGRSFLGSKRRMERIMENGFNEARAKGALNEVNHTFGNYGKLSPFERHVVRRWMFPFWSFYRHSTQMILRFPFESPLRAQVVKGMEQAHQEMLEQYGDMPEWLSQSIPLGPPGTDRFMAGRGASPFGGVGESMINMMNPFAKGVLENQIREDLYTKEPFSDEDIYFPYGSDQAYDIHTGQPVAAPTPGIVESILSSAPQWDMLQELRAGGKTYDTASIGEFLTGGGAIIDPDTGQPKYPSSLGEEAGKFFGFPTTTYDLAKYQERRAEEEHQALLEGLKRASYG